MACAHQCKRISRTGTNHHHISHPVKSAKTRYANRTHFHTSVIYSANTSYGFLPGEVQKYIRGHLLTLLQNQSAGDDNGEIEDDYEDAEQGNEDVIEA